MKSIQLLALAFLLPAVSLAQDAAQHTPEEIAAAIENVNRHIESRQLRATELTNDLISLDGRVETRIDKVVAILEGITDSEQSQIQVALMKERVIEGLKSTIQTYDEKRRAIQEEVDQRDPRLTREELFSDLGKFDERVDKRVEQIIGLTKSMQEHKDYPKMKTVESGGYWGWDSYEVKNPEYQSNVKQVLHTEAETKEIAAEIDAAIARLESQNRDFDEKLKKDITDKYREMLTYEKNRNLAIIAEREAQKEDLLTDQSPGGDKVGSDQARQIQDMLEDMAGDLRRDFDQTFNLYRELNEERATLKTLNEQLAEIKAMQ